MSESSSKSARGAGGAALADSAGLAEVERLMRDLASTSPDDIAAEMVAFHLDAGGKRLRARLALAALAAFGVPRARGYAWAAACELVHNATLVHDDLQDRDERRRGQPTVWARYGDAQAVNAGDLMLMLPFLAVAAVPADVATRWALAESLARATAAVVRGQAAEQQLPMRADLAWGDYERVVSGKTSALFELPVLGAALLADELPARASALARPFRTLGVIFQMQDDVLDLYGDKGRGLLGSDIYEGKVSCLVVEHLSRRPGERDDVMRILRLPRAATAGADVTRLIASFRQSGALGAVLARMRDLARDLDREATAGSTALASLAAALVETVLAPIAHLFSECG